MKKELFVLLVALAVFSTRPPGQGETKTASSSSDWRDQIVAAQKSVFDRGLDIIDDVKELHKAPQYSQLETLARNGWRDAIEHLDLVAPSKEDRFLLLVIFQNALTPREYVQFLERTPDLFRRGKVDSDFLRSAVVPQGRLGGVLADNFKDAKVRAIALKLRQAAPTDRKLADIIDVIISGRLAENLNTFREFDTVPRVSLSKNKVIYAEPTQQTTDRYLMIAGAIAIVLLVGGAMFIFYRRSREKKVPGQTARVGGI